MQVTHMQVVEAVCLALRGRLPVVSFRQLPEAAGRAAAADYTYLLPLEPARPVLQQVRVDEGRTPRDAGPMHEGYEGRMSVSRPPRWQDASTLLPYVAQVQACTGCHHTRVSGAGAMRHVCSSS